MSSALFDLPVLVVFIARQDGLRGSSGIPAWTGYRQRRMANDRRCRGIDDLDQCRRLASLDL